MMFEGICGITKLEFIKQFSGLNISGLEELVVTSYGKNVILLTLYNDPK